MRITLLKQTTIGATTHSKGTQLSVIPEIGVPLCKDGSAKTDEEYYQNLITTAKKQSNGSKNRVYKRK